MVDFAKLVYTPAGRGDASLAICACRAGGIGILNAELTADTGAIVAELHKLASHAGSAFGIKVDSFSPGLIAAIRSQVHAGLQWLIVEATAYAEYATSLPGLRNAGVNVLLEITDSDSALPAAIDGLVIKGNEAGGFVGEDSSFIMLQKCLKTTSLPLYVRGGLTPHVAAACAALGVAGGVLDSQLLLMEESQLPESLVRLLQNLAGTETVATGNAETGEYFRLLVRPALTAARRFAAESDGLSRAELRPLVLDRASWLDPVRALLPIGHDVAFAAAWRKQFGSVGAVLRAIDAAVLSHPALAQRHRSISAGAPLAQSLGIRFPIIQGPMTRVSDTAQFALEVSSGGALPMLALAVMKGRPLEQLLEECAQLMGQRPWGVGLLGFAPQELLDEQLAIAARFAPTYAIIAGGRPDQAVHLERGGVPSFLHVPSPNLIPLFLQDGARRFIFEGRECGGHIGPLSSFVLWSAMIDRLVAELPACKVRGEDVQAIFAGGIHDDVSSAMLQIMCAPLAAAGVQIGILMGSAYLFTREIVSSGAIVEQFQKEVLDCDHTVNLESGVGHASRCAYSPFAADFFRQRATLRREGIPADESRRQLDELILGRLRIASKGLKRGGTSGELQSLAATEQHAEGMYMLGQVATLRHELTDIGALHREVTTQAADLIDAAVAQATNEPIATPAEPADIAIVGMACALPKANSPQEYWDNIVAKVDAITEIPAHRWDWRLYFDADRDARDKVYSKWGGFLDDLPFDPIAFGMPPKSIKAVDPMQLMGLEIARRTLADSGYDVRPFDRERAAVIIGVSGGIGDVGMQYGLRSEIPRFTGALAPEVAARLPDWTEDSFAGILPNVAAGRIANRLNFGGMNMTTDAACASSLAAIYQAVTELTAHRSDFAIAGGLDTVQGPFGYLCFSKTQALSPRGKCSTFDSSGDGIAISEGIAMVALKRLADAQRDGDRIYCVIKGIGSSSDGNAKGLTAPLPAGQLRAMRRAYRMAGFDPSSVGLFEAHGTGTVAGDTAELESTTRLILEHNSQPRQAVIGSVKTMIGHTKATAGAAGMMKAALALHHRVLPPHNNVTKPIEALSDATAPLYVLQEAMPWIAHPGRPRRAACSAFGFGGTNFHIVLEEYGGEYRDWLRPAATNAWSAELCIWSDADRATLLAKVEAFAAASASFEGLLLRDLAASVARNFKPGGHTLAIVAKNVTDLGTKLRLAILRLRGEGHSLPPGVYLGTGSHGSDKIAVLFPGQGSQYPGMAREAALHFQAVGNTIAAADHILEDAFVTRFGAGRSLEHFIYPRGEYDDAARSESRKRLASTDVAQPALGAVEAGLYELMKSLGLRADMFGGHSYGEFVALFAAGAIDFAALLQISAARGRFIVDAASAQGAELGTMAAVNAPRALVQEEIAGGTGVVLANHNAPTQSVISGTRAAIQAVAARLREVEVEVTELPVAAAFHSSLVEPAQRSLGSLIDGTPWAALSAPVYSNTTARPHASDPADVQRQMTEHLVRPVEFVAQIEAMYADGARLFVEIGPKAVLTRLVSRILADRPHRALAIDDGSGMAGLLGGIGQMLCAGIDLDIASLYATRDCRIGDPAHAESLSRRAPLSKHAWMLNGSAARRATDPVPQVGVTHAQAIAALAPVTAPSAPANPSAVVTHIAPVAATAAPVVRPANFQAHPAARAPYAPPRGRPMYGTPVSKTARRKDPTMDDRRSNDSFVIGEYFATMRQFLETQERVMDAFLGADGLSRTAPRSRLLPVNSARASELAAAPAITPTAKPFVPIPAAAAPPPRPPDAIVLTTPPVSAPAPVAAPTIAVEAAVAHKTNGSGNGGTHGATANGSGTNGAGAHAASGHAAAANGTALNREKLLDVLLGIVEEKTGYPRDMLGLDQNLESDLGIDSIKRVEVVGAFLKFLPDSVREALSKSGAKLSTRSTLNAMLDLLAQTAKAGGAVSGPFDSAGTGVATDVVSHPSRLVMRALREPLTRSMNRRLTGGQFILTRDSLGVADKLLVSLRARGAPALIVEPDVLTSESRLLEFCASLRATPVAGVVHLAALGTAALTDLQGPCEWRAAIQHAEKSFFILLRELSASLVKEAHVVAACGLGGQFGRETSSSGELRLQGGAPGTLKSLLQEREDLRLKAVDLDPGRSPIELTADLLAEIELDGGRQEVGYPGGERTVFVTVGEAVQMDAPREAKLNNLVVLATGGSRGITAEVLRELALPGNTLVLTGRSLLPEVESPETAQFTDADSLRKFFVAQVRGGTLKLTPADIQRRVQSILGLREMRANLADFRACGAAAHYYSVDVTDETALGKLITEIRARFHRIDGVVHGAGVIEDKLLADKSSDSWSRVVDTKVIGLLLLQKLLDASQLKFFTVFSSVAGRYGNSGQSDYATANELMNRLCVALQARWGSAVAVSALCWGPWGPTKFGAGMVTAETEAKFKTRGVDLVSAALGRQLFRQELSRVHGTPVEVICGSGPWEAEETRRGVIESAALPAPAVTAATPPMLLGATVATSPTGKKILTLCLSTARQALLGVRLSGAASIPAVTAVELLAEAARLIWPQWRVAEIREFRVLDVLETRPETLDLEIHMSPPPYGSSAGFDVSATVQTVAGSGSTTHFQCVLGLQIALPAAPARAHATHTDRTLQVAKAYGELISRESRLQVIEKIEGFSAAGAGASVRRTIPTDWLGNEAAGTSGWLFDPGLLDAAAQMVCLWTRNYLGETVVAARYGRIARYREELPARLRMEFTRTDSPGPEFVRGDVVFFDEHGEAVLVVEDLDCSLNSPLDGPAPEPLAAEGVLA